MRQVACSAKNDYILDGLQSGISEAEAFLNRNGVQPDVLVRKGNLAAEQAGDLINRNAPQVSNSVGKLSAADPTTLGKYALGLAALYFLVSPTLLPCEQICNQMASSAHAPSRLCEAAKEVSNQHFASCRSICRCTGLQADGKHKVPADQAFCSCWMLCKSAAGCMCALICNVSILIGDV